MAHETLALHHSPDFHTVLDKCLQGLVEDVSRLVERHSLPACSYEYPESSAGACDGQPCAEKATVSELSGDHAYCAKHFRAVTR